MAYTVTHHKYGIAIEGPLPIGDMNALVKKWQDEGYDQFHSGIAHAIGANFVITNKEGAEAWEAEIEQRNKHRGPVSAWWNGIDTGISSLTIVCAITGRAMPPRMAPNIPRDPDDFGRCRRMFDKLPQLREQFHLVGNKYPNWVPFVEAWDELDVLWDEESPSGTCPKLYERMQQLRGDKP